jgi:hypothetical protein
VGRLGLSNELRAVREWQAQANVINVALIENVRRAVADYDAGEAPFDGDNGDIRLGSAAAVNQARCCESSFLSRASLFCTSQLTLAPRHGPSLIARNSDRKLLWSIQRLCPKMAL